MNKKEKNIEMKIYELLGVKIFKRIIFKLFELTKEERKSILSSPSNYNMKIGNGTQDLKDFKKMIKLNSFIHIMGLIISLFAIYPINIFLIIINSYCLMLQRYNDIRINKVIKKMQPYEEFKKKKLIEQLKSEDSCSKQYIYEIKDEKKDLPVSFDELIKNATYSQLKSYREKLLSLKQQEKNMGIVSIDENKALIIKKIN